MMPLPVKLDVIRVALLPSIVKLSPTESPCSPIHWVVFPKREMKAVRTVEMSLAGDYFGFFAAACPPPLSLGPWNPTSNFGPATPLS